MDEELPSSEALGLEQHMVSIHMMADGSVLYFLLAKIDICKQEGKAISCLRHFLKMVRPVPTIACLRDLESWIIHES